MPKELPVLNEAVLAQVQKIAGLEKVQKALQIAKRDVQRAMDEQVELCEIPAPTFMEGKRAQSVMQRMKDYGLTDVKMDEIGNVIGVRKGMVEGGPILVLGAHMDSVFPIETDVTVKKRRYPLFSARNRRQLFRSACDFAGLKGVGRGRYSNERGYLVCRYSR